MGYTCYLDMLYNTFHSDLARPLHTIWYIGDYDMILLTIFSGVSLLIGFLLGRAIYRRKLVQRTWERNKAMDFCDQYREVIEGAVQQEAFSINNNGANEMLAGFRRASRSS